MPACHYRTTRHVAGNTRAHSMQRQRRAPVQQPPPSARACTRHAEGPCEPAEPMPQQTAVAGAEGWRRQDAWGAGSSPVGKRPRDPPHYSKATSKQANKQANLPGTAVRGQQYQGGALPFCNSCTPATRALAAGAEQREGQWQVHWAWVLTKL
jgi:hypothetical protein